MKSIGRLEQTLSQYLLRSPALPFVLASATAILWALIENLGAFLPAGYSAYQIVWVRYGVHLIFLMLIWFPLRKRSLLRTQRSKGQILRGLLMLGMPVCFILAVGSLSASNVWSIFWLSPLLAMILSSIFLKEPGRKRIWAAAGIAFIGSLVILRPHPSSISLVGVLLVLGMAACFSLYLVGTRILAKEDTITSLFFTAATVFVPLTALMPFVWKGMTAKPLIVMTLIGLAGFGLLFALDRTLETSRIGRVAPILASEPVWYSLFNSLLFRVPLHLRDVIAGLIILAVGGWSYFSTVGRDFQPSPDTGPANKSISYD